VYLFKKHPYVAKKLTVFLWSETNRDLQHAVAQ